MRNRLETELLNVLAPYRKEIPFEDIKAQYTIILNEYEVESRKTEVAIRDDDKNTRYLAMFLASKAAGGRTEQTLRAYRNYLNKQLYAFGKPSEDHKGRTGSV